MDEKQPRFCHLCGKKLHGSFYLYGDHLVVCADCNATVPRCSQCNVPSLQLTPVRGVLICPSCRQKAPVCPVCHIPILGNFYLIDDSPIKYCETCIKTRPRCDICRTPLDEHGKVFQGSTGNVTRCATCLQTAIIKPTEAERLYRETYALLKQELQLDIPLLPQLYVVERARLVALNQQSGSLAGSDTPVGPEHQHLLGFFQRINDERTIYIERLLPQTLFKAVAAHELAHAWQSFYAPSSQSPMIVEGFAEWAAYRLLLFLGQQRDAAHLTRRDDLYGKGLQYFIALERQLGRSGVLQRAKQA
ncbi:MAG: hypothetical protein ACR2H5_18935 [Ktedonobacteraceae bacterium]